MAHLLSDCQALRSRTICECVFHPHILLNWHFSASPYRELSYRSQAKLVIQAHSSWSGSKSKSHMMNNTQNNQDSWTESDKNTEKYGKFVGCIYALPSSQAWYIFRILQQNNYKYIQVIFPYFSVFLSDSVQESWLFLCIILHVALTFASVSRATHLYH